MFIPELVGNIQSVLNDIGQSSSSEIIIDQAAIAGVVATLDEKHDDLSGNRFQDLHVPPASFGTTPAAMTLGDDHLKAHQVITETLDGVLSDLIRFRDGLKNAERLISAADTQSAADLDKKRAATETIVRAATHSAGDQRNHEARNHYLREHGGQHA